MRRALPFLLAVAAAAQVRLDPAKVVDLTYTFDEKTIYWPNASPFKWEKESWGVSPGGYWYASARFAASEHGGTHIDSPIHFGKGRATVDQIPVERLIAPAFVIDVSAACAGNRDYAVRAADLAAWEKAHGRIPARAVVLIRTGWGKFWPDRERYLGTGTDLHFPGLSPEAAAALVERKIAGVGIDTASIDPGPSKDFKAHQVLNGAGIYGLENVANLERVPAAGAWIIALPMKIGSGTGGPVRIVAVLP